MPVFLLNDSFSMHSQLMQFGTITLNPKHRKSSHLLQRNTDIVTANFGWQCQAAGNRQLKQSVEGTVT